jgi:hypothetical protein
MRLLGRKHPEWFMFGQGRQLGSGLGENHALCTSAELMGFMLA